MFPVLYAPHRLTCARLQLETELHSVKKQKTTTGAAKNMQQMNLPVAGPSGSKVSPAAAPTRDTKADAKTLKARSKSLFDQCVSSSIYFAHR